jgi:acetyltransferase-like isoleucine patch superfamily enzyme
MKKNGFWLFLNRFNFNSTKRREFRLKIERQEEIKSFAEDIAGQLKCVYGHHTYCGYNVVVFNRDTTIGNFVSIASNVSIGAASHHLDFLSTSKIFYSDYFRAKFGLEKKIIKDRHFVSNEPCKIGNDVWIGQNVVIKNGLTIGDGAVLAAGAIVMKDVPAYAIVGGVSAKIIKFRFDQEIIKELLEIKWWDLPFEIIDKIPFENVLEAIKFIKKQKEILYRNND